MFLMTSWFWLVPPNAAAWAPVVPALSVIWTLPTLGQTVSRLTEVAAAEPKLHVTFATPGRETVIVPCTAWAGTAGSHAAIAAETIVAMIKVTRGPRRIVNPPWWCSC